MTIHLFQSFYEIRTNRAYITILNFHIAVVFDSLVHMKGLLDCHPYQNNHPQKHQTLWDIALENLHQLDHIHSSNGRL